MDVEALQRIIAQLTEVRIMLDESINSLDLEMFESPETGKTIALDFDDSDLTDLQISIDAEISILQELSNGLTSYL